MLRPKAIVLDLLSPRGRRPMAVAAIVEACAVFGITGNAARVTLARLLAEGRIERIGHAAYGLSAAAETLNRHVRGWSGIDALIRPWNGAWITVHLDRAPAGAARKAYARALRFARLAAATPTMAVRPDNLRLGPEEIAHSLRELGFDAPYFVARSEIADREVTDRWMRELWPIAKMRAIYARLAARLGDSLARLDRIPFEQALAETFTLGGETIRELAIDPLLPDEMISGDGRAHLLKAMREYDRAGRALWRRFNARFEDVTKTASAPFQTLGPDTQAG